MARDAGMRISISGNLLEAYIEIEKPEQNERLTKDDILDIIHGHNVSYGILMDNIEKLTNNEVSTTFPLKIAQGRAAVDGEDGSIRVNKDTSFELNEKDRNTWRDILSIPSVTKGEKIAVMEPPTQGIPGINIYGEEIAARPGKPAHLRAGQNVQFKKSEGAYYATTDGQLNRSNHTMNVLPVFEVDGDIDLKTGNLSFVGSILIRGDVPSGYRIEAGGDITIQGMVEGSELLAGGSIHIGRGIAGQRKATLKAGEDIQAGYISQAKVEAGKDLAVRHYILHSQCMARQSINCCNGQITGGTTSAGLHIEAKDIGNPLHTLTGIYLGMNKTAEEKIVTFESLREKKKQERIKLMVLGKKLEAKQVLSTKDRILFLRQKSMFEKIEDEISHITNVLEGMTSEIGDLSAASVTVHGRLYPNVQVGFGKYHYPVRREYKNVKICMADNEVAIRPNDT